MKQGGPIMESEVMTMDELCDYLRIHRSTGYRLCKAKKIPHFRVGSDHRFVKSSIDEWMDAQVRHRPARAAQAVGRD